MSYDKLKAGAKELFIDLFIEFNREEIIEIMRKFLSPLKPGDMEEFVASGTAPPLPPTAIKNLKAYEDYIEKINPQEVFEFLSAARPDLGELLVSLGDKGAEYVVKLKQFIVDSVKSYKEEPVEPAKAMVKLHCESCGKNWILPKEEAEAVIKCPFCGIGKEEETNEPEEG